MNFDDYGLVLRKDTISFRDWDSELRTYTEVVVNPIKHLWTPIAEIADDYTLRDLFNFVAEEAELWELITGEWVIPLIADMDKDYGPDPDKDEEEGIGVHYLVYEQSIEIEPTHTSKELRRSTSFHGMGLIKLTPGRELEVHEEPRIEESGYAISLSPIPHLLDYPLRIDVKAPLIVDYEIVETFEVQTPKLVELVKEIFWELTFHGLPEDRNQFGDELRGRISEIDECIESGDPEVGGKFVPFDLDELMGDKDLLPEPIDNTELINKLKDAFK